MFYHPRPSGILIMLIRQFTFGSQRLKDLRSEEQGKRTENTYLGHQACKTALFFSHEHCGH